MFSLHPYFFSFVTQLWRGKCLVLLVKLLTYHVTDTCYVLLQAFDSRREYSGFATPMKVSV